MEITPAERITHQIATKAKNGALWIGVVVGFFAFAALAWNIWSFRMKLKDDDKKWREERRLEKITREEDKKEKKKEREEDKTEKQKERNEAREEAKKEREEAREEAREEGKKAQSAIDALSEKVTELVKRVTDLETDKREQREKRELLERLHQEELSSKQNEIDLLKQQKKIMKDCLDREPLPGWLPGSPGETWGQYLRASPQS